MEHVELVADRHNTTRIIYDSIHGMRLGNAIVIGIDESDDLALAPALAKRTNLIDPSEYFTGRSNPDASDAGGKSIWREQSGLELFGNGDVNRPPFLGMGKCRHEHGGKKREKRSKTFHKAKSMSKGKKPWRESECNATFFPLSGANGFRRG